MNRRRLWEAGLAVGLAVSLVFFVGCGKDKTTQPSAATPQTENLDTPNGGLTGTNEQPGFGDASLTSSMNAEVTEADATSNDAMVKDIEAGRTNGAHVYAVTILWGMLQAGDSGDAIGTREDGSDYDWSGSLVLNQGAVVLRNVVSFEPGDHMILPRPNRGTIEWESHTGTGFDGVRVLVYIPPQQGSVDEPVLTLNTRMFQDHWNVSDLADLDSLITVDGNGNKVHIMAFETRPGLSARGYFMGRWQPIPAGEALGHFEGLWITDRGNVSGFVRGHYGINKAGEKVFFGKYIDRAGVFQGIIRGQWGTSDAAKGADGESGWFRGALLDASLGEKGQVNGVWTTKGPDQGFFQGRWCLGCTTFATTTG